MSIDSRPETGSPKPRLDALSTFFETLAMLGTGFAGAWLASFANYPIDRSLFPERLGDGQYVFPFLLSVPVGWVSGTCLYRVYQGQYKHCARRGELNTGFWIANAAMVVLCLPLVPVVAITLGG